MLPLTVRVPALSDASNYDHLSIKKFVTRFVNHARGFRCNLELLSRSPVLRSSRRRDTRKNNSSHWAFTPDARVQEDDEPVIFIDKMIEWVLDPLIPLELLAVGRHEQFGG
jgi:hypothetical protein|tara:strand:+ start:4603 stop:4935 length:333 start_codon:yes stop_codon:yes gene_type:complete